MKKLTKYFQTMSNNLECNYKHSSNLNHSWLKWDCRENFIVNFMNKTFPQKFVIWSWEIIDSLDVVSRQADIIIYDENMPVFDYWNKKHFLSWWVLAHIEVKSKLDKGELIKALNICNSVKKLQRDIDASMHFWKLPQTIPSLIFAYDSIQPKKVLEYLLDCYNNIEKNSGDENEYAIDWVCVLNKFVIIRKNNRFIQWKNGEDSLMLFFTKLFDCMSKKRYGKENIIKYTDNIMLMPF